MAITLSRLWMYSQRANSITMALFGDGMAGKSKLSKLFTAGNRAARIRRSTPSAAHWGAIFPYSLRKLGLCKDCGATAKPAQNGVRRVPSDTVFTAGCGRPHGGDEKKG